MSSHLTSLIFPEQTISVKIQGNLLPLPKYTTVLAFAVSSSQVSTVSQADLRSDSPNSYFLDQPKGA